MKFFYCFFCSKDHQWTPGDNKNQQKISIGGASMNSSGTTWPNQPAMGAPFGGVSYLSPIIEIHNLLENLFIFALDGCSAEHNVATAITSSSINKSFCCS